MKATPHQQDAEYGCYLYAFIDASRVPAIGEIGGIGLDGAEVVTLVRDEVAAVLSSAPPSPLRPERRHLMAHQAVINKLMEYCTPLPVAFGIIADDQDHLRALLEEHQTDLKTQLSKVQDTFEYSIKASWTAENIFEYLVGVREELSRGRDRIFGAGREPTRDEKIALGQLFEQVLGDEREELSAAFEAEISASCADVRREECRDERQVSHLVCLVPRDGEEDFERTVQSLAAKFDDNYRFEYSGPWAPYNFVNLKLAL